jgi:hypothetical protein
VSRHVITYEDALGAARRRFLATSDLKMDRLQRDLNVSRATLYRVVTSRDRLLGDVLFDLGRRTFEAAVAEVATTGLTGVERILEISRRVEDGISTFGPVQRFLATQPQIALPVLFTAAGRVHERMVDLWAGLFADAVATGELDLPDGPRETACLYVRVGESMLYASLLAGVEPDADAAQRVRRAVLGAL